MRAPRLLPARAHGGFDGQVVAVAFAQGDGRADRTQALLDVLEHAAERGADVERGGEGLADLEEVGQDLGSAGGMSPKSYRIVRRISKRDNGGLNGRRRGRGRRRRRRRRRRGDGFLRVHRETAIAAVRAAEAPPEFLEEQHAAGNDGLVFRGSQTASSTLRKSMRMEREDTDAPSPKPTFNGARFASSVRTISCSASSTQMRPARRRR